jgi:DNA processing protein
VLCTFGQPAKAWHAVRDGRAREAICDTDGSDKSAFALADEWTAASRAADPALSWAALMEQGIGTWVMGCRGYPARLESDHDKPPILFWRGEPGAVDRPAVAIVGTRRCTGYGSDVARHLGRDLSLAGVSVVSGLALGVDGAAHAGALSAGVAPPIGVVGSGLDVVYPSRHRSLWRRVGDEGLLLSEAPLGSIPEPWRFPQRNRVIAALATVVVVVESHASGGSLSTVRAATERGIPVMAVPGSIRSPASAGTNRLLADGVAPVTDVQDVLVALSLEGVAVGASVPESQVEGEGSRDHDPLLEAVDWTPTTTEQILRRTGLGIGELSAALTRLEVRGLVRRHGGWWERVGEKPEMGR